MNRILSDLKRDLKKALGFEVQWRKNPNDDMKEDHDNAIAQKTVSRAIISMIPQTGKKPDQTNEEDIIKLLRKYISMEKERTLYEKKYILESDIEGKSASEVKKLVKERMTRLGDTLTSTKIKIAQKYLPKQVSDDEIIAFVKTIDMSQFKNKMQAMGLIMKQFKGLDGNIAKRILMKYE